MSDPWAEISPSSSERDHRIRRADKDHPLDWFRGRDAKGNYLFILYGRCTIDLPDTPRLAAVNISLSPAERGKTQLILALKERSKLDLFRVLCSDLLNATRHYHQNDCNAAFSSVLRRLRRWQQMLDRAKTNLLTRQEQIGLVGELLFLRDIMGAAIGVSLATLTWGGPDGDEQDFHYHGTAVEVKSRLISSDSVISVSSATQLDPSGGPVVLCCQSISIADKDETAGVSLNELVKQIRSDLSGTGGGAVDRFEAILLLSGYESRSEYDAPSWKLASRDYFSVEHDFPSLRASTVPIGISQVRYKLSIAACEPFRITQEELTQRLFAHYA